MEVREHQHQKTTMFIERGKLNTKNFLSTIVHDLEELNQLVRVWDVDFHQLDHGKLSAGFLHFGTETTLLTCASFDRSSDQRLFTRRHVDFCVSKTRINALQL